MSFCPNNLLIVGAGFSWNAGLPLASEFTRELLNLRSLKLDGPSAKQVEFMRRFVDQTFGEGAVRGPDDWPEMEDIFTIVDLSANTGHHLGAKYSASELRIVRRSIIVRMIRMLTQAYSRRWKKPDRRWNTLEHLFKEFDTTCSAVLSMNWDTVFERGFERNRSIRNVEYGCGATAHRFEGGKLKERPLKGARLHILKPHGSINWLYCDSCREMFWVPPSNAEQVAQTLFRKRDWEATLGTAKVKHPTVLAPPCPHCKANSLGTRFATFSYRKALDFPMHAAGWRTAEEYLKSAVDWIFFGYSMPAADFEFKHLLKRVQLSEPVRPRINQAASSLLNLVDDMALRGEMQRAFIEDYETTRAERSETAEAGVLRAANAAFIATGGANISVGEVTDRFNRDNSAQYGGPRSNRWVGHIIRTRLHLTTRKSDGLYVIAASEKPKIESLMARMGLE